MRARRDGGDWVTDAEAQRAVRADKSARRCAGARARRAALSRRPGLDLAAFERTVVRFPIAEGAYHLRVALAAAIFRDLPLLLRVTQAAMPLLDAMPGYYPVLHAHLLRSLALAAWAREGGISARPHLLEELAASRSWLAERAADSTSTSCTCCAWWKRRKPGRRGDTARAGVAYDAAVRESVARQRHGTARLIAERAGLFFIAGGLEHTGRRLLEQAGSEYEAWGAVAKVDAMRREHAWLESAREEADSAPASQRGDRGRRSGPMSPDTLDLLGVLRASQALSSETSVGRLAARVVEILAAMTGATHVDLLSRVGAHWWVHSQDGAGGVRLAGGADQLPLPVVDYVARTQEPLRVEDDVAVDERFAREPYFAGKHACSLLAVPLAHQGTMRGVLVLQNDRGRAAFSGQRLDAVRLVGAQLLPFHWRTPSSTKAWSSGCR